MFLVYTEPSTMRIDEIGFEQLANMVCFRASDFVPLTQFSLKREVLFKTLFMPKNIDKYALFLPKLFAHTASY